MKNKINLFFVVFFVLFCMLCMSGCQSTDKSDSVFNYNAIEQSIFEYNEETNKTKVVFNATLTNNTIYNCNGFSIMFNLYSDSNIVNTETYNFNRIVKNGASYTEDFYFYANGQIDSIEFVSWTANYSSAWDTYNVWFIVSIILVTIIFVIYLIFMIIEDLELFDTVYAILDFCEYNGWIFIFIFISLGSAVWGIISSHWVPVLIVVGAIISLVLLGLIAHFIKSIIIFIYDEFFDYGYNSKVNQENLEDDEEKFFDNQNDINKHDQSKVVINKHDQPKAVNEKTNSLEELDKLIGLENVKIQLKRIRAILLKNKDSNEKLNLHMCFYGNPGTGKTVVARLMANIFYEAGVLPTNKLIETDRSGLVGQYIGETAPLTHKKVQEAMGGVLFIDEAYSLYQKGSENDFGHEAITALLKDMEDYNGKFCVILAGYKDEMEKMIALNPGFDSRINRKIVFPDYSIDEQLQIFNIMLAKKNYSITDAAKNKLLEVFEILTNSKHFANARTVRNILDGLVEIQAFRTIEDDNPKNDSERIISLEDVEQYYNELNI